MSSNAVAIAPAGKPAQLTETTKPAQRTKIWFNVAVRLADEGVPVRAIVRALMLPYEDIREALEAACERGMLLTIPRDDWPPGTRRDERQPDTVPLELEDDQIIMLAMRVLGLTPTMARIFVALMRRTEMTKNSLHQCMRSSEHYNERAEPTGLRIVDVYICRLRDTLPKSIKIVTLRGIGFYLPPESKAEAYRLLGLKHDEFTIPAEADAASDADNPQP